jgi:hypothetical protein
MWRYHPDNGSPEAWWDMTACVREATDIARQANVVLAFEPEVSNVVDPRRKFAACANFVMSQTGYTQCDPEHQL